MIRKRKASDALVSASEMKKHKNSSQDSPKLVHPLLPLANENEFEDKPLSRTRPKVRFLILCIFFRIHQKSFCLFCQDSKSKFNKLHISKICEYILG